MHRRRPVAAPQSPPAAELTQSAKQRKRERDKKRKQRKDPGFRQRDDKKRTERRRKARGTADAN